MSGKQPEDPAARTAAGQDTVNWVVVGVLLLIGLVTLVVARQLIAPIDGL